MTRERVSRTRSLGDVVVLVVGTNRKFHSPFEVLWAAIALLASLHSYLLALPLALVAWLFLLA